MKVEYCTEVHLFKFIAMKIGRWCSDLLKNGKIYGKVAYDFKWYLCDFHFLAHEVK